MLKCLNKYNYIFLCFILVSCALSKSDKLSSERDKNTIEHTFQIKHPGKGENNIETVYLVEVKDENQFPIEYYMEVESVICYENLCKIVPVRLFWNVIGEYQRYEMVDGAELEKYEGEPYAKTDYEKTDRILKDSNSPFKTTRIDEILTTVKSHDMVDAIAGETLLEMDEKHTVRGATLTCYTLWHWAHGGIVEEIRGLTGQSFEISIFITYLESKNTSEKIFAIEQMTKRGLYNADLLKIVLNQTISEKEILIYSMAYIENTQGSDYFSSIKSLFAKEDKALKIVSLNSLLNTNYNIGFIL